MSLNLCDCPECDCDEDADLSSSLCLNCQNGDHVFIFDDDEMEEVRRRP